MGGEVQPDECERKDATNMREVVAPIWPSVNRSCQDAGHYLSQTPAGAR